MKVKVAALQVDETQARRFQENNSSLKEARRASIREKDHRIALADEQIAALRAPPCTATQWMALQEENRLLRTENTRKFQAINENIENFWVLKAHSNAGLERMASKLRT